MAEPNVLYEVRDGVGLLTLNRPRVLNALDTNLVAELADAAERAAVDPDVWLTVLRGAGRAFCSGIDRTALSHGEIDESFYRQIARATNALEDMPKLSIAVLHGWSIGGGLQIACACDVRLAADDTITGFGATRHGLVPDAAILRIARLIGLGRANELALLNDHIGPDLALAWGLVNWIVPAAGLDAKLAEIVDNAFHASRTATAHSKRLLRQSFHRDPRDMIEDLVAAQRACHDSWELRLANDRWTEDKGGVRFYPPPASL
jgi:enoyl-CoA hydratase/carnithine racemase